MRPFCFGRISNAARLVGQRLGDRAGKLMNFGQDNAVVRKAARYAPTDKPKRRIEKKARVSRDELFAGHRMNGGRIISGAIEKRRERRKESDGRWGLTRGGREWGEERDGEGGRGSRRARCRDARERGGEEGKVGKPDWTNSFRGIMDYHGTFKRHEREKPTSNRR
ncbi:hypothetical protein KM043_004206 [Ampulex compressa]|nr:hypothetical protein KM043_004206 [Ampulex compressa]